MNRKIRRILLLIVFILSGSVASVSFAINRFPKPEFESGHQQPQTMMPVPRSVLMEYADAFVLLASLSLVTWFVLKKRNRKGVFYMTVFSVLYFGFYRKGCICAVGSIQNISMAMFNHDYVLPLTALIFFVLPLIFTLLFGRTFCAGVCPLGAIQDLVAFKPVTVRSWVEKMLGIIPFIYLAFAVLYSATATDFIICRYDPFVGFYRIDAGFGMLITGALMLFTGVFIARPYCRYLCPYGAILSIISRLSYRHMTITPAACINCRLCENSCPYGAINKPVTLKDKESNEVIVRRYFLFMILIPFLAVAGGFISSRFYHNLAMANKKVHLAYEIKNNSNFGVKNKEAVEITGFKSSGEPLIKLYSDADRIESEFYIGSWFLGAFIGLIFGFTLLGLSVFKYHTDYNPDKATCHSCARCMKYCPVVKLDKV